MSYLSDFPNVNKEHPWHLLPGNDGDDVIKSDFKMKLELHEPNILYKIKIYFPANKHISTAL